MKKWLETIAVGQTAAVIDRARESITNAFLTIHFHFSQTLAELSTDHRKI